MAVHAETTNNTVIRENENGRRTRAAAEHAAREIVRFLTTRDERIDLLIATKEKFYCSRHLIYPFGF